MAQIARPVWDLHVEWIEENQLANILSSPCWPELSQFAQFVAMFRHSLHLLNEPFSEAFKRNYVFFKN